MASTTPNLNLKLLGTSAADKETYFESWRQDINGESGNSNMRIIDTAVGWLSANKADKTATVSSIEYDSTTKKIKKTINGTTTDVVSVSDIASDMDTITNSDIDALFA